MERSCSKHRQRRQRSESRCRHQQNCHNHRGSSDSITRNYYAEGVDIHRSNTHRRQPVGYEESRNRKSSNSYHNHNHNCHHKHRHDNPYHYEYDTSDRETSSYTSSSSSYERMPRYDDGDGHCRKRHNRRSPPPRTGRNSRRSSSDSNFTPMNYGTPGCAGCQQQQQWAQSYASLMGGGQAPPPAQGGWKQISAQPYGQLPGGQAPPQQQPQNKPPPQELEELRKSVFKGIKEFSKSLRNQQWFGDMDYLRSSRNVKHGHKGDTLEKHQCESKRKDWVPIY